MKELIHLIFIFVTILIRENNAISSGNDVTSASTYKYECVVYCPVIMCSCVLINVKAALTTATCINNLDPSAVQLYLGSNKYYTGGLLKDVSAISIHPKFGVGNTYANNIAMLGVDPPVSSADMSSYPIQPATLCTSLLPINSYGYVTAYGATNTQLDLPDLMQVASLKYYGSNVCNQLKKQTLTPDMFCAGDPNGNRDLCPEDQGGPFAYQGQVCGIYSWGCSCGLAAPNPSSPVFVNLVYVTPWITSTLKTM